MADAAGLRRAGIVQEPEILLLVGVTSVYELAQEAIASDGTICIGSDGGEPCEEDSLDGAPSPAGEGIDPTLAHRRAVHSLGPSALHRRSFKVSAP